MTTVFEALKQKRPNFASMQQEIRDQFVSMNLKRLNKTYK